MRKLIGAVAIVAVVAVTALGAGVFSARQSPDRVELYQWSNFSTEWQHVATLHGWVDDYSVCLEIARCLDQDDGRRYDCRIVQ